MPPAQISNRIIAGAHNTSISYKQLRSLPALCDACVRTCPLRHPSSSPLGLWSVLGTHINKLILDLMAGLMGNLAHQHIWLGEKGYEHG
jgi:hypothetical protein